MEELKRVQELRIDEFSRRRLIENQDTTDELTARIQELQNEVNCLNDSRDSKDAESVRSGLSHVTRQTVLFPSYRDPGGLLSRSNQPPDIWNSQGTSGNVFVKTNGVFFSTLSARVQSVDFQCVRTYITACNEWTSNARHSLGSEMPVWTVSQKFSHP